MLLPIFFCIVTHNLKENVSPCISVSQCWHMPYLDNWVQYGCRQIENNKCVRTAFLTLRSVFTAGTEVFVWVQGSQFLSAPLAFLFRGIFFYVRSKDICWRKSKVYSATENKKCFVLEEYQPTLSKSITDFFVTYKKQNAFYWLELFRMEHE